MRLFLLILLILCLIPCISAERIEIHQGDFIYQNETVDISLAGSWPDFALAWCASNNPECVPPDQVVYLKGNLHTYWMDPAIFKNYGEYYRWDGEWHRGENALAFTYKPGTRPVYENLTVTNETGNETSIPVKLGPYRWVIARGDDLSFTVVNNRTDTCHLWIWTTTDEFFDWHINSVNSTYFVKMTSAETRHIPVGSYKGYLQFDGDNKIHDIWYDNMYLSSPYNNKIAPEVPLTYWNLGNARSQFDEYAKTIRYYDDVIVPIEVVVEDPTVTVTSVTQEPNKLYISGTTNWKENTSLTLKLDPENYPLANDMKWHTWQTWAEGDVESPRYFSTAITIDANELSVGAHHIEMQKTGDTDAPITSYDFMRTDIYIMPTPTPERMAVITAKDYSMIPVKTTVTQKPVTTATTKALTPVQTAAPSGIITPGAIPNDMTGNVSLTPTFVMTIENETPTLVPTPTPTQDRNIHVPLPFWIPVAALALVFWRRHGR